MEIRELSVILEGTSISFSILKIKISCCRNIPVRNQICMVSIKHVNEVDIQNCSCHKKFFHSQDKIKVTHSYDFKTVETIQSLSQKNEIKK